jgi:1-acylglycerone phosphate reductase
MLSETLRLELAPFHVRVITLMSGNVASNITANTPAIKIPSTSYYLPVKAEIAKEEQYADMPTKAFAEQVVSAVVGGSKGKFWLGGNIWIVRTALFWLPGWAVVSISLIGGVMWGCCVLTLSRIS